MTLRLRGLRRRLPGFIAISAFCLLGTAAPVSTALAQYRLDSWTAEDGLPQNTVTAITQTRDGYLWLATFDGLVRFDGVRFTVFDRSNSPGITSNRFTSLYEDSQGDLWAGSEPGGVTRLHDGRFTSYSARNGSPSDPVWRIAGDGAGNLWVLLKDGAVMRWADGHFEAVAGTNLAKAASVVRWGSRGGFWSVDRLGLHHFSRGRLTTCALPETLLAREIASVAEEQDGTLWLATRDGAVARLRNGRVANIWTSQDGLPGDRTYFVAAPAKRIIRSDGKGNVWFWDDESSSSPSIVAQPSDAFPKNPPEMLYQDREGNIWVATLGRGLLRMSEQVISTYSIPQGLPARNIYPIYQDRSGAIWIGAWESGVSRFKDGVFTNYSTRDGLPNRVVISIHEDREGRLWVGTYGGMRMFDNGKFAAVGGITDVDGVEGKPISAIYQDREGALWFGTGDRLARYKGGATRFFTRNDGLADADARVILEDSGGNLWIGAYGGLTRYKDGGFTAYTERDGLPSNSVRALYEDRDGVLWIGTYDGGLGRFKDGRFTRYTTRQGLFSNGVFQILEDARGNLWMSCNRGIYRVRKQELNEQAEGKGRAVSSIAYGQRDGMLNVECNGGRSPAGIRARDGRLWFPTQDGVAVVNAEALSINRQPPPVVIESFLLDREPVAVDRPVRIPPGKENFEIRYTALSFIKSDFVDFKYKLSGLDSDWIEAGTRRTAYYSHVPPGNYTFTVIAANSDIVWGTEGASLRIVVDAPFWRTWWFLSLVSLAAAGTSLMWHRRRVARLEEARAVQVQFSQDLMESQEHERKRIAAELHDGLGQGLAIIKNRALLSLTTPDDLGRALEQLHAISEASGDLIDEVKEIAHGLRPYQLDRLGLTRTIEGMIRRVAETHGLRFASELDSIDGLFPPEAEINIFRIVQESVNNIVKHARATDARVMIRRQPHLVEIIVRDNGTGIVPGSARDDRHERRGFGLIGMAERARQIGGDCRISSVPGQGTTMSLSIPLQDTQA